MERLVLRELLQQAHLRDADLPQRSIRRESQKIRMGGKKQGILIPFVRRQLLPPEDEARVIGQAKIVLLNLFGRAEQASRKTAGERGFSEPFEAREEHRLLNAVARDHPFER